MHAFGLRLVLEVILTLIGVAVGTIRLARENFRAYKQRRKVR